MFDLVLHCSKKYSIIKKLPEANLAVSSGSCPTNTPMSGIFAYFYFSTPDIPWQLFDKRRISMTKLQQYVKDYGFTADEDFKAMNDLFINKRIKCINCDVELDFMLLLRAEITKPNPMIIRNRYKIADDYKDGTIIFDIAMEYIRECVYQKISNNFTRYIIDLNNGIRYTLLVEV